MSYGCEFSILNTWKKEVIKLNGQIDNDYSYIKMVSSWISDNESDISKSAYLSSQVIREAYDALSLNKSLLASAINKLEEHKNCLLIAKQNAIK